ncbi:AAA family ATPase [Parapedobacter tibetensis]|uniref:AAA family ATPase n=1 Tax=Parapedobacter tibetensis TaxID=2972951 RepID=UPI00214DC28A|nr:ATP-binding protein [Parapedobacter tibetensis]
MIIIIFGLPGSGKTFLAGALALRLNGLLISSDKVRNDLKKRGQYDKKSKHIVYRSMLTAMISAIKDEQNTVLDATFQEDHIRKLFLETAMKLQYPLYFIEMRASEETIKERISKKRVDSEADFEVYLKIKEEFEPMQDGHLVLYSDQETSDTMIDSVLTHIGYQ